MQTGHGACPWIDARGLIVSAIHHRLGVRQSNRGASAFASYPPRVRAYLLAIMALGLGLALSCLVADWNAVRQHLPMIAALGLLASIVEFYPIKLRYSGSISISVIAYTFAFIVLPPSAAVAVPLPAGLIHAVRSLAGGSRNWHRAPFNTAQLAITVFATAAIYGALADPAAMDFASPRDYLALLVAGSAYFAINTSLVAVASGLVRRLSVLYVWRANYADLVPYFLGLLSAGAIIAVLWHERPLLVPLAMGLAVLLHRALNVPNLLEVARTDPKTGLYNVQHFYRVLGHELLRATRFGRPLSVIVADLDYLREINNAHGHLAGDIVLKGASVVLLANTREYDLAARFGGEEFALLLLETEAPEAVEIAERIRRRMESSRFEVPTGASSVRATLSLGVACFPGDGQDPEALIYRADLAMYRAKRLGRNRVCLASDEGPAEPTAEARAG